MLIKFCYQYERNYNLGRCGGLNHFYLLLQWRSRWLRFSDLMLVAVNFHWLGMWAYHGIEKMPLWKERQKVKDNSPHPKCLTSGGDFYVWRGDLDVLGRPELGLGAGGHEVLVGDGETESTLFETPAAVCAHEGEILGRKRELYAPDFTWLE